MVIIRTLLIILEAACCLSLIGLILLQKSKSGGLGMAFGGGGNDSLLGARAGNILTKATVGISGLFLVNTLVLGMLFAGSASESLMDDSGLMGAVPAAPEAPAIDIPVAEAPVVPEAPVAVDVPVDPAE